VTDAGHGPSAVAGRRLVLLVGPVGAGKGTQAAILGRELGLVHLASGNLFREALRDGTDLGEQAREYMDRGDLVPDDITIGMVIERLSRPDSRAGAILDGFPRTVRQAEALDETLAADGERIAHVVYIEVPVDEVIARVSGRSVCPTCGTPYHDRSDPPRQPGTCDKDGTPLARRDDDRPEVVRARLDKQVPPMLGVIDHYERAGVVHRIDGTQPIDRVTADILAAVRD
jgi:adenylate kinase